MVEQAGGRVSCDWVSKRWRRPSSQWL